MDMGLSKLKEIVKDREAWCAVVREAAKSQTPLSDWTITVGKQKPGRPRNFPRKHLGPHSKLWKNGLDPAVWACVLCHRSFSCASESYVSTIVLTPLLRCWEFKISWTWTWSLYFQEFFSAWKRQSPVGGSSHRHKHTNAVPREYTITHMHKLSPPQNHLYTQVYTQWNPWQLLKKNERDCLF